MTMSPYPNVRVSGRGFAAYLPLRRNSRYLGTYPTAELGMDVVTANKGPIAWTWQEVSSAAASAGRRIRFESTVMDGLPVFSLLEYALPDCRLLGFEAVFNATTNFIIDAMGTGRSYDDALAHVQAEGYAEAGPGQRRGRLGRGQQGGRSGQRRDGGRHHSRRRRAREPGGRAARADPRRAGERSAPAAGLERVARHDGAG